MPAFRQIQSHDLQVLTHGKDFTPGLLRTAAALLILGRPRRSPSTPVLATLDRILVAKQADINLLARLLFLHTCLSARSPSALHGCKLAMLHVGHGPLGCDVIC